jgi:hypothetical protein
VWYKKKRENLCKILRGYEDAYLEYLVKTWRLDPTNFRRIVDDMEAFIDLKNKLCPRGALKSR